MEFSVIRNRNKYVYNVCMYIYQQVHKIYISNISNQNKLYNRFIYKNIRIIKHFGHRKLQE